jgi:hypothetical protein
VASNNRGAVLGSRIDVEFAFFAFADDLAFFFTFFDFLFGDFFDPTGAIHRHRVGRPSGRAG